MLAPDKEVNARYLRTLRQTLNDVILPEIAAPAARNAVTLCDYILLRMMNALEELPAVRSAHADAVQALLRRAAPDDAARVQPWEMMEALQHLVPALYARSSAGDAAAADLLLAIAREEASSRRDIEAALARVEARRDPAPQALSVTAATVQAYLDRRYPNAGIRVCHCQPIPGGRSKLTVLLGVEPNARLPEGMVLRLDVPDSAITTTVIDEYPVIEAMYARGVAAPEPLWLEADSAPLGAPFIVTRRMPGSAAGDLFNAERVAPELALALADTLASIHAADSTQLWPGTPGDARGAVRSMLNAFESSWRVGDSTPSLVSELAYGWLNGHLSLIEGPAVPVHGDAHFANILAENNRLVCLLDWEFAHPGHPAEDLAYCRRYVEASVPWADFMVRYRAGGGAAVSEEQLRFFSLWAYLRNITYATNMLRDYLAGSVHGIQSLAIALNTRVKLEALLSQTMAEILQSRA
jgi:aminoglycoside phosphotransferase (APT) family kinase protein